MIKHDTRQLASDTKFYESYSRFLQDENRYETWVESVDRVCNMHRQKYESIWNKELEELLQYSQKLYYDKLVLGAQRSLQFGGEQILKHNAKLYNCSSSHVDRIQFFSEYMYLLLCGAGVGFSIQKHHIEKLPKVWQRSNRAVQFTIEDSIEGWADAIQVLMESFFEDQTASSKYFGKKVYFDFSKIRPKGSLISGGFKAPGPEPLRKCIAICEEILTRISYNSGIIKTIEAYDIAMHIADAVISGGVRRAATIALFSHDDVDMLAAKTGNWFVDNPQRARANNSVILLRSDATLEKLQEIAEYIKQFGEPGFILTDNLEHAYNPCFTGNTKILTDNGWRSFNDLIDTTPTIVQDNRVIGSVENDEEVWDIDLNSVGVTTNVATKVGLTQKNADVFKLTLSCGREVEATGNHAFATSNGMINLEDLVIGDEILIGVNDIFIPDKDSLDYKIGNIFGLIYGDGGLTADDAAKIEIWGDENKNYVDIIEKNIEEAITHNYDKISKFIHHNTIMMPKFIKNVSEAIGNKSKFSLQSRLLRILGKELYNISDKNDLSWLHLTNKNVKAGFMSGIFWADGHVEWSKKKNCVSLRLSSSELNIIKDCQLVLQELGLFSKINIGREAGVALLPDSNREYKEYNTKKAYRLIIGGKNECKNSLTVLSLADKDIMKINEAISNSTKSLYSINRMSTVSNIEYIGKQDVYCLQENNRRTLIAEGLVARRCVEIGMLPVTEDGQSGFQMCNLTEINGSLCDSKKIFFEACKAASIIGTIQAGYTDFRYLTDATRRIVEREALLGVSITGWMNNPQVLFDEETLRKGAEIVKETNKKVAKLLNINQAARVCCVKPSGSASVLLKTANGIHGEHSKYYIRHIQMNKESEIAKLIKKEIPEMLEESVWSSSRSDYCLAFPFVSKDNNIFKNELLGVKQLEYVKKAQQFWVENGTNVELCTDPKLRHNVSNTITVDDWDSVINYVYENKQWFAGISFIPMSGDKDYAQAPNAAVLDENAIIAKYGAGALFASGLICHGLDAFNDDLWLAISTSMGMGLDISEENHNNSSKRDFVKRFKKFADSQFNGDLQMCSECLKDVHYLHKWEKVQRALTRTGGNINWSLVTTQKEIDIDTMGAQACSGVKGCEM